MGLSDYLILAGILILAVFAVRYAIQHRKHCCGDCSACAQYKSCKEINQNSGKENRTK